MSLDLIDTLTRSPEDVFALCKDDKSINQLNQLVKTFIDPITKDHSVLDEIYTDGLDSSQVYGQTKMVLEGMAENLLYEKIPKLKEKFGNVSNEESDEISGDNSDNSSSDEQEDFEDAKDFEIDSGVEAKEQDNEEYDEEDEEDEEDQEDQEDQDNEDYDKDKEHKELERGQQDEQELAENEETVQAPQKDVFGLNDEFFDIDEFNKQTLAMDENEEDDNDDNDEEIDYFGEISDGSDDEEMPYFDDYFQKPGKPVTKTPLKKTSENMAEEKEEEEEELELQEEDYDNAVGSAMNDLFDDEDSIDHKPSSKDNLSSFERQQLKIQEEIAKLEAESVAEKKWSMKGEVSVKDRPQDSLLDDVESQALDFERTSKPVPVITQEVTETLEDMIRRRIKEENFDDLPKRLVSDISQFRERSKFELSEEKSTKSLAEIYEDDFKGEKSTGPTEISEALQSQHDEITQLFNNVTYKLDALCSAHFIPKPHQIKEVEIKVTDGAPASISMEDAQPLTASTESTLAPQEVFRVEDSVANGKEGKKELHLKSGLSYSKDELSREDKQRLRRAAKRKRSKEFKEKKEIREQKLKQHGVPTNADGSRKKAKVGEVMDTLSKAKNITVVGKKGEFRDIKGNIKKSEAHKTSTGFKL